MHSLQCCAQFTSHIVSSPLFWSLSAARMTLTLPQKILRILQLGANLHPIECAVAYLLPLVIFALPDEHGELKELVWRNTATQVALFVPLCQLPVLLTGKMSYVDIAWPLGLCALALRCLGVLGDGPPGHWVRRQAMGWALLLHGGRMLLGGLWMFFPYNFPEDLSRYQFAKQRFLTDHAMPLAWWPLKAQVGAPQPALIK